MFLIDGYIMFKNNYLIKKYSIIDVLLSNQEMETNVSTYIIAVAILF